MGAFTRIGTVDPNAFTITGTWSQSRGEIRDYWAIGSEGKMYVKLCPGGVMHEHQDSGKRIHIILKTNPDAVMTIDGIEYRPELGGIYLMDVSLPHSSVNNGTTDRIHLVLL